MILLSRTGTITILAHRRVERVAIGRRVERVPDAQL
jgi:hypothetical protein